MLLKIYYAFKYSIFLLNVILLITLFFYLKKLQIFKEVKENLKNRGFIKPIEGFNVKKWKKIEKLLNEPYPVSLKLAVLEAYGLVKEALKNLGYKGDDFKEIINQLKDQGFKNLEILKQTIENVEKIVNEKDSSITQLEAKHLCFILKKFYNDLYSLFI